MAETETLGFGVLWSCARIRITRAVWDLPPSSEDRLLRFKADGTPVDGHEPPGYVLSVRVPAVPRSVEVVEDQGVTRLLPVEVVEALDRWRVSQDGRC